MKNYLDTNIASVYAALPPGGLIQQTQWTLTRLLWDTAKRRGIRLVTSSFAKDELRLGDPGAARRRLNALRSITVIEETEPMRRAARLLMQAFNPRMATVLAPDIRHYAAACAVHADTLVTWNIRHFDVIDASVSDDRAEDRRPRIVTPAELAFDIGAAVLPNPDTGVDLLDRINRPTPWLQKFIDEETRAGQALCAEEARHGKK
jgi:predicted nucleic acid-binding protein